MSVHRIEIDREMQSNEILLQFNSIVVAQIGSNKLMKRAIISYNPKMSTANSIKQCLTKHNQVYINIVNPQITPTSNK